ncbi:MAG: substrate-binding periplasmic protein, partial [Alphaproteobacteria bacterium]
MKKTLCVAAFLALIVPTIGQAANTGKLRACTIAWPPYTISKNEDGKLTGIDVDILREIARRMNKDIKISDIPWKRCLRFAEDGNIDIV